MTSAKDWIYEHRGPILAALAVIAVVLIIAALTLSWFLTNNSLSTVAKVDSPAELKITVPGESAATQLDLTSDADYDEVDDDGNVYRRRAFSVDSGGKAFELQVANTTNISGLSVKIYRVRVNDPSDPGDVKGDGYSWSKEVPEVTGFTSIDADAGKSQTFDNYEYVQTNAAPNYRWKRFEVDDLDRNGNAAASATNFIIECSWPKDTNYKETDVVYLIAKS
ncbi:hypothetical protein [uncultured Senegalimassilia sp.]|uniref:hypothetical protein n=1 Tax=uncultured Senegalimassilia sp. TaxID=1714350 RepID=UPI0025FC54D7|nr:hypothetical protein [uncultured Senegalimassilia sp.]